MAFGVIKFSRIGLNEWIVDRLDRIVTALLCTQYINENDTVRLDCQHTDLYPHNYLLYVYQNTRTLTLLSLFKSYVSLFVQKPGL